MVSYARVESQNTQLFEGERGGGLHRLVAVGKISPQPIWPHSRGSTPRVRLGTVELVMETQISAALFDSASGTGEKKGGSTDSTMNFGGSKSLPLYSIENLLPIEG